MVAGFGDALVKILEEQFPDWFPGRPMTVVEGKILVCIGLLILALFIYYLCTHKPTKADREWGRVNRAPFVFIFTLIVMLLKKIVRMFSRKK